MVYNKLLYNPQMKSAYNFVPGVMGLILMLICAMMTSISIVREKETGTMEVLLVSPVNPLFIILSKAVSYFVLSLLNLTTILLLSVFVLDVPIAGSLPALLVSAMVLMIPTIILSGIIFPIESMPGILQVLSCLIPARWYVETVRRLMIESVPLVYVWKEVAVMCLMAGGNEQVILCERGIRTFEKYTRNTLDLSAVPIIHEKTHLPVIVDPSHATGKANLVEPMMIAAVAAGADGLEVEVHYDPRHAWSDGAQCLTPGSFAQAMAKCRQVAWAIGREM